MNTAMRWWISASVQAVQSTINGHAKYITGNNATLDGGAVFANRVNA